MRAAVLNEYGAVPLYGELPELQPQADEVLLTMEAASIKQLDKLKASGKHYTLFAEFPTAVGVDGVGRTADGQRVYAMGISGMLAEFALAKTADLVPVPENLSASLAAVLPNALLGSDAALVLRRPLLAGETLYINGATGVSGRMAVQAARLRGAGKIIVAGRNAESLAVLKRLGADETISLLSSKEEQLEQLAEIQATNPISLVLDYLGGEPLDTLLTAFSRSCPQEVDVINIGQMAGATLNLPLGLLRSQPINLLGSGLGSLNTAQLRQYNQEYLPEMFNLAAEGKLEAGYTCFPLAEISQAWQTIPAAGERVVVEIN